MSDSRSLSGRFLGGRNGRFLTCSREIDGGVSAYDLETESSGRKEITLWQHRIMQRKKEILQRQS